MVELYWEAYCRDVPFIDFATNPIIARAVADIAGLSGYQGPKPVTPQTIFRYQFTDALNGPYVSQFLLLKHRLDGVDFVPRINTRARVADPNTGQVLGTGFDYMTNLSEYLNAAIPEPLVYERQGWLLQPKMALGGSFDAVKERHAVSVLGRSDFAIITLWSAEVPTIFPFDRAMQELRPRLLEVCQRSFVPLGDFRFSDRQVRLYVRPSVALDGEPDGWISSRGLTISGAARVFRARPRIELQGNTQFEWLGGRVPVARAELVRTDGDFRTVPVKLVAAGPS